MWDHIHRTNTWDQRKTTHFCLSEYSVSCIALFLIYNLELSRFLVLVKWFQRKIVCKKTDKWYIVVETRDDEWHSEWQRTATSDAEWQRVLQKMITSGTTNGDKWQRVVQRVTANDNEWQCMTASENKWQWVAAHDRKWYNEWKRHSTVQRMDDCHQKNRKRDTLFQGMNGCN